MTQTTDSKPAAKPKKKRKSRSALAAIGLLLVGSAILRTAVGATEVLAKEGSDKFASSAAPHHEAEEKSMAKDDHKGTPAVTRVVSQEELVPLLNALNAREARVKKRESDLQVRLQALAVAEKEIKRKIMALESAEQALRDTMAKASTAAEDDIARLTEVYANMKPKQAAALFEEMAPDFAAGFISRMRSDSAAAIMAGLSPQAAYLISVVMAGRNANVPDH